MSAFREHYLGGVVTYTSFFLVALTASLLLHFFAGFPLDWNPTIALGPWQIAGCFVVAVLSGLWPDVDIKSRSQQIYYRIFIIANLILVLRGYYRESAFFGLFAMLPLVGKHRGWTHSRLTMLLLPAVFLLLPIHFHADSFNFADRFSPQNLAVLEIGLPFYIASVIGYATHLHLDGILLRFGTTQRKKIKGR